MTVKLSPSTCAELILINIALYGQEKEKEVSRARLSRTTLKKISGRRLFRQSFLDDLFEELLDRGWFMGDVDRPEFFLLRLDKVQNWTKVSSSRIQPLLQSDDLEKIRNDVSEKYAALIEDNQAEDMEE